MKKRVFGKMLATILAAAIAGVMLVGCGEEKTSGTTSSSSTTETKQESTENGTTEETTDVSLEVEDDSLQKVLDKGKLVIATSGNFRPITYVDEEGNLTGFDIELGTAVAEKLGVEVEFVTGDIAGLLTGMQAGQYDLCMSGMTMSPARMEVVDFSMTYGQTALIAVTQEDNDKPTGLDDFSGLIVGSLSGTPQFAFTESVGGYDELKEYTGNAEAFQDLKNGRMDIYVVSKIVATDFIANDTTAVPLKMVGETRNPTMMGIAMPKNEPTLKEAINAAMQEMIDDGSLDALSIKYFGEVLPRE